jgi:hypothetical protein
LTSAASTAFAAVVIRSSIATPAAAIFDGSASTMICLGFSPQIATLATPGTSISRGRSVHCAIMDRSVSDTVEDVSPICITRLVAETIGYICGTSHHDGRVRAVCWIRSWTS